MTTRAIVDTHTLIWFLDNRQKLGKRAEEILTDPKSQLIIPAIVLCELCYYLRKKGRPYRYAPIYQGLKQDERVTFLVLEIDLITKIPEDLEMHDGLIAAHCLENEGSVIVSQDLSLREWDSNRLVWD